MEKNGFTYAHNNTSVPERRSRTAGLNKLNISEKTAALRKEAQVREVPVACDETLAFLLTLARAKGVKNYLEVGCAVGLTSLALAEELPEMCVTAIERDENFYNEAKENLAKYYQRSSVLLGDAAEILKTLPDEAFDFIFLDCAKVQYIKLLPELKRALCSGGVLLADDVLLYGWVNGEAPVPKKRKMLVEHIREYLAAVTEDCNLRTAILDIGDGLALSVKL